MMYNYLACTDYYTIICLVLHWKTTMHNGWNVIAIFPESLVTIALHDHYIDPSFIYYISQLERKKLLVWHNLSFKVNSQELALKSPDLFPTY